MRIQGIRGKIVLIIIEGNVFATFSEEKVDKVGKIKELRISMRMKK